MKKICFGKNITSVNNRMTNLTDNIKGSLKEVYRFPQNLVDISNCFNGCSNFTKFEAILPDSIQNMSSSFEGCGNFYKNVAIPLNCIDMSRSFKSSGIKGTMYIPEKVGEMQESFLNSKVQKINFYQRVNNDNLNNIKEAFKDCNGLISVDGEMPLIINIADNAFSNTSLKNINFLKKGHYINIANGMFQNCKQLLLVSNELNINSANNMFRGCSNLQVLNNIKGNNFSNTWSSCSNLHNVGVISGNLYFNNTFKGIQNYTNIVYLNPDSLNIDGDDSNFLKNNPLRIYGTNHSLTYELDFQNSHKEKGDYISGFCDPDDFEKVQSDKYFKFYNWSGNASSLVIPKYFRTNLLDDSTKYSVIFNNAFMNKTFGDVVIYGGDISTFSFNGSQINNLKLYPEVKINNSGFFNVTVNDFTIFNQEKSIDIGPSGFSYATIKNVFIYPPVNNIKESAFASFNGNIFVGNIHNIYKMSFNNFNGSITSYDNTSGHTINIAGENAFINMTGSINMPIRNIQNRAFYNAINQKFINLSYTTDIGEDAFYNSGITALNVPDNIRLINNSFRGMWALRDLNIFNLNINHFLQYPSSLKNVVLRNTSQPVDSTNQLYSVENITMLHGGNIADNQFRRLSKLKYFTTTNYPYVGKGAFLGCSNLLTISPVSDVSNNAFNGCSNLISASVGDVADNAFNGCSNLISLKAFKIEIGALEGCKNLESLSGRATTWHNLRPQHIGLFWGVPEYIDINAGTNISNDKVVVNTYSSQYGNYQYAIFNISNKLKYADIYMYVGDNYCTDIFTNVKSLEKIVFGTPYGNFCGNVVKDCNSLKDFYITTTMEPPNYNFIQGIPNIVNITFDYPNKIYTGASFPTQKIINTLTISNYGKLNNVNFGSLGFTNNSVPSFYNCHFGNFSNTITILPDVFGFSNQKIKNNYTHAYFANTAGVPTKYIGVNSHPLGNYYYSIPSYGMNLNSKTIYFDNKISLSTNFFENRNNLNVYVEDISNNVLFFNGSSNINLYYTNLSSKPNIWNLSQISNSGNNNYYSNNINLIYQPNYNYSKYVANLKK